jgi:hypothetical protein
MNVDTGELRMLTTEQMQALKDSFMPVPDDLQEDAKKELSGKESTIIDLKADTPLARWAGQERKHQKKNNRRQMAKASRRKNRR